MTEGCEARPNPLFSRIREEENGVNGVAALEVKFQASESRHFRLDATRQIIGHPPNTDSTRAKRHR